MKKQDSSSRPSSQAIVRKLSPKAQAIEAELLAEPKVAYRIDHLRQGYRHAIARGDMDRAKQIQERGARARQKLQLTAQQKATCAPNTTRKGGGGHPKRRPTTEQKAKVAAWVKSRPNARLFVADARKFHALRDTLEYEDLQMLRAEWTARCDELEKIRARRNEYAAEALRRQAEGHKNVLGPLARYRVALQDYIDCLFEIERIKHRGRFLRSVLKTLLAEREEPGPKPPFSQEAIREMAARQSWAEGRTLDLDIEDYGRGEFTASGDDAPEEWRDWAAAEGYHL